MYYDLVKSNGTIALVQEASSNGYLVVDRRTDEVLKKDMRQRHRCKSV